MTLILPKTKVFEQQAKMTLRGVGLEYLRPILFTPDVRKMATENETYQQIERIGYDKKGGSFGLPVWDTVTLQSPAYTDDQGRKVPSQKLTLDLAIIEAENDRNIVVTKIAGRSGTVKEYMSDGDAMITIRGMLVSPYSNLPPSDLITAFQFISSVPVALSVESNFLEYLQVFSLVITKPILKQREGTRNTWDYELQCLSDTPIELA